MGRVAVIGAGIAGLTAAHRLSRLGIEPIVFEARDRVGGMIRSERCNGFLFEHGPNSIQSTSKELEALVGDLGLDGRRIRASEAARLRYVVRDGRPVPAPTSPPALLKSDLFGVGSKLRLLFEPFVSAADPALAESVADFVRRRFGQQILDYGMDPFVAGVYAGDPELLSLRHAFPSLYEMEHSAGSIIKGQLAKRKSSPSSGQTHRMFSFDDGLEVLPAALQAGLTGRIRTESPVKKVELRGSRWSVYTAKGERTEVDGVIYAAPLHALAGLERPAGPEIDALLHVVYPPLSVMALGYRREHVGHRLDGFGMLVPGVEDDFQILGTLFTSSIFPGRAPDDHVLLTTFAGGMRHPPLGTASETEVYDVTRRDLRRLLDISGDPVLRRHVVWKRSIPQYHIGYGSALETMDRLERTWPGWFMAGNFRGGISVGGAVDSGAGAARRCAALLDA